MKKNFNYYSTKTQNTSIKNIDLGKREVAVYLSTFDVIDSDNDMIVKGAFLRSIKDRGANSLTNRKIAYLRYHDWQHQIGKFLDLQEDNKGLFAIGKLGTSTKGEDALRDYEDGIITEHSIGFQYIEDAVDYIEDSNVKGGGYYRIKEVKLYEGSAVTFGANPYTNVVSVSKGKEKDDLIIKLSKEIEIVTKALINGRGTDDRLYNLEMKLKYLNSRLVDLANTETAISPKAEEVKQVNKDQGYNWGEIEVFLNKKDLFNDYPKEAVENAKKGIELNKAVNNSCATAIGKQRGQDIAQKRGLSLEVLKRTYAYLTRAKEYYNPADETACGTISYLLWGGEAMRIYSKNKLDEIEN